MSSRIIPVSDDKVAELLRSGRTATDLANEWGVKPQTVRKAGRAGGYSPGYDTITVLPVRVMGPRAFAPAARGLRGWATVRNGGQLAERDATRFETWKQTRDKTNTVVEFSENYPPNPASPTHGGWHYEKRRADTPADEYFQETRPDGPADEPSPGGE
jgi:hypothetical protein